MDINRSQRYDIDEIDADRITLALDELNYVSSPYTISLTKFSGNNWVKVDDAYVKYNIAEDDNISFIVPAVTELSEKNVTSLTVSFDYVVDSAIVIDNIALVHKDVIEQKTVESVISGTGHIDIVCDIFELKQGDANTIISDEGFIIGINLDGNKSNTTVRILNVNLSFEFDNKLQDEMNAVANRISGNFDTYVEEEDLVIEFLGTTGQGGSSSGGGVDIDTVKHMIANAMDRLGVNFNIDLMSNGYLKMDVELDKGDE